MTESNIHKHVGVVQVDFHERGAGLTIKTATLTMPCF